MPKAEIQFKVTRKQLCIWQKKKTKNQELLVQAKYFFCRPHWTTLTLPFILQVSICVLLVGWLREELGIPLLNLEATVASERLGLWIMAFDLTEARDGMLIVITLMVCDQQIYFLGI